MIKALRHRILMFFVLAFAVALYAFRDTSASEKGIGIAAFAGLSVIFIVYHLFHGPWRRLPLLAFLPLTLGAIVGLILCHLHFDITHDKILSYEGTTAPVTAVVKTVSLEKPYASIYTVDIKSVDGDSVDFSAVLTLPFEYDASERDVLSLTVTFSRPAENDLGFEERAYYASQGILLTAEAAEDAAVTVIGRDSSLFARFRSLSSSLADKLKGMLGDNEGGLAAGILLGHREAISDAVKRDFRYLGISHTLAVSGLHLSILVGGLLYLLRSMRLRQTPVMILASLSLLGYLFLTGFPPSVVRAGIMLFLMLFLQFTSTLNDPPTNLAIAVLVILLFSPGAIIDPGFLLSVSATAGLLALGIPASSYLFRKTVKKRKGLLHRLVKRLSPMLLTVSAMLFTLPFVFLYFGEIAPLALVTNLFFLPLISVFLFLSAMVLLLSTTPLAGFMATLTAGFASFLIKLTSFVTLFTADPVSLRYPFVPAILVLGAVLFLLLLCVRKKRLSSLFITGLAMVVMFSVCFVSYTKTHRNEDTVVAISLGNNDYFLLHSRGHTLLCDLSDGSYSNLNRAAMLAETTCYDTSVDTLLLTHLHRKHISSFARLADNIRLRQLLLPSPQTEQESLFASALIDEAVARGVVVIFYPSEETATIYFDDCELIIAPLTYLDRSVQPMHLITIRGSSTMTYVGSAVTEVIAPDALSESDVVWFGTHGPNIKRPLTDLPKGAVTVVSSDEVNEGYGLHFDVLTKETGYYHVFTLN